MVEDILNRGTTSLPSVTALVGEEFHVGYNAYKQPNVPPQDNFVHTKRLIGKLYVYIVISIIKLILFIKSWHDADDPVQDYVDSKALGSLVVVQGEGKSANKPRLLSSAGWIISPTLIQSQYLKYLMAAFVAKYKQIPEIVWPTVPGKLGLCFIAIPLTI